MSVIWSGVTEEGAVVPVQVTDEGKVVAVGDGPQGDYLPTSGGNLTGDLTLGADGSAPNITLNATGAANFNGLVRIDRAGDPTAPALMCYDPSGRPTFYLEASGDLVTGNSVLASGGSHFRVLPTGKLTIGDNVKSGDETIVLNPDGSAEFSGGVESESSFRVTLPGQATSLYAQHDALIQFTSANDSTQAWSLAADGSASFAGKGTFGDDVIVTSGRYQATALSNSAVFRGLLSNPGGSDTVTSEIRGNGSATFSGDVVIGSRGDKWLIRESNGVAMLVQQSREAAPMIPEQVRDIPGELDLIEMALNEVMEKLRMTPPAGWPVWDGSDNP